jgi:hypothetical protein
MKMATTDERMARCQRIIQALQSAAKIEEIGANAKEDIRQMLIDNRSEYATQCKRQTLALEVIFIVSQINPQAVAYLQRTLQGM